MREFAASETFNQVQSDEVFVVSFGVVQVLSVDVLVSLYLESFWIFSVLAQVEKNSSDKDAALNNCTEVKSEVPAKIVLLLFNLSRHEISCMLE